MDKDKLTPDPREAEVHRMPEEHPAWPATEADAAPLPATEPRTCCCKAGDPCDYHAATCTTCGDGGCKGHPLPATEKPAEARGIEDQSQALMLAVLHWHDTAHRMNTKEPASRCPYGPCQWAQDGIRTLRALASPPPQAQPEASDEEELAAIDAAFAGSVSRYRPAQPEETPKRIGGRTKLTRLEWVEFGERQQSWDKPTREAFAALIAAAFGKEGK